ncbi:MAG: MBOAT family protein [Clostridia bacterium]|nr:MBOAT family protein [Clostridia bacterium]
MLFTSYAFIGFLGILLLLYYLLPRRMQWKLLLAASLVFYSAGGVQYLTFVLVTATSSYGIARLMGQSRSREDTYVSEHRETMDKESRKAYRAKGKKKRLRILLVGLCLNFGILAVLKYTAFAVTGVNSLLGLFGGAQLAVPSLLLPMGISFYTFQTMGYLMDVYRGKAEPEKNFFRFTLFVSFFPQMVQGPISRFGALAPELFAEHSFDGKQVTMGLWRILWGFFKKLVIADRILIAMNTMLDAPENYQGAYTVLLILLYSVDIYADFTGGIDITIGTAQALGIRLAENFNHPFLSRSTKEYWNRWHITMGTWFTDYIFDPLSVSPAMLKLNRWGRKHLGNHVGSRLPVYLTTAVTWFLTGLWHGAGWNFIVWGMLNCLVLLVSDECKPLYRRFHYRFPKLEGNAGYGAFCVTRPFLLMGLIRSLDCYRNVGTTFRMWGSILTTWNWGGLLTGGLFRLGLNGSDFVILGVSVAVLCAVNGISAKKGGLREKLYERPVLAAVLCSGLLVAVLLFGNYGVGYDAQQFIYNQF